MFARPDASAVIARIAEIGGLIREDWNGYNVLHAAAARVGALDLGFLPKSGGASFGEILRLADEGDIDVVYNLGADEFDASKLAKPFVIYQGHHGDAGAQHADVIFPGASFAEQSGVFVNTEGRAQMALRAHFPYGEAREDWAIIRALSDRLGGPLPYDDLFELRRAMIVDAPSLGRIGQVSAPEPFDLNAIGRPGPIGDAPFRSPIRDYYLTNAIARASRTMAECSAALSPGLRVAAE